jgi:hypothetical protein
MRKPPRESRLKRAAALMALLLIAGFAVAGPTGLLAWSENASALEARKADLASELVRDQLGVMREDEVVITLEDE